MGFDRHAEYHINQRDADKTTHRFDFQKRLSKRQWQQATSENPRLPFVLGQSPFQGRNWPPRINIRYFVHWQGEIKISN
jgi:hypothetical protein